LGDPDTGADGVQIECRGPARYQDHVRERSGVSSDSIGVGRCIQNDQVSSAVGCLLKQVRQARGLGRHNCRCWFAPVVGPQRCRGLGIKVEDRRGKATRLCCHSEMNGERGFSGAALAA